MATSPNYSYSNLGAGDTESFGTFTFSSEGTVRLTVVQYTSDTSQTDNGYRLRDTSSGNTTDWKHVKGNWKSEDAPNPPEWTDVLPGTYQVQVHNYAGIPVTGNFYVVYP
ncbi:hypothetical protein AAC03nite_09540 [Alicyclobacillus acidoterrestris]|nr:hypothetical protein AAC03nite_09540 [Alicyclobacillus acidoterrestris]